MSRAGLTVKDAFSGLSRRGYYVGFNVESQAVRFEMCGSGGWYSEELPTASSRMVCFDCMTANRIIETGGHTGKVRVQVSDFLYEGCIKENTEKYPEVNWWIL